MAKELQGGCLCGSVRFRATQEPLRTVACHCTFCQRWTGSSHAALSTYPAQALAFNSGTLSQYEHLSDGSGKKVCLHFCSRCGTTVSLSFERWPGLRAIPRGCLDDPNAVSVASHIWTRSAPSDTALPEGVDCFVRGRMTLDGHPEPSVRLTSPVMARSVVNP